ncbi:UNKNOWN [Stylonychia lemnae]|uniref:Uncharacterized protein n=1 Tax=Stylonychia lemnae TaxID=5949 RepID=A0A078AM73_STYLE|nr:UNKNOWN [Stylonychia lemnae]|eukprot:CDW82991.1 UNKNOWN [Stylonychia lemnae]
MRNCIERWVWQVGTSDDLSWTTTLFKMANQLYYDVIENGEKQYVRIKQIRRDQVQTTIKHINFKIKMMGEINSIYNIPSFQQLARFITGDEPFPKHLAYTNAYKYFEMMRYRVIRPHSDIGKSTRKNICGFLNGDATFSTASSEIEDIIFVYKIAPRTQKIHIAASFQSSSD